MADRITKNTTRISDLTEAKKFSNKNITDWHPADVKGSLEKRGLTLAEVSRRAGYHATAAGRALRVSWPEMERIIAEALDTKPWVIWPSRYVDQVPSKYLPRTRKPRR
jgi:Ner family transcriptional regulator